MPVQLVETGVKFPDGTTQITAATTPVTSVNGQTGAVNISIPPAGVTSVNGYTGAVTLANLGFANYGGANGWQLIPGGLIIQWGRFYAGIGFTYQSYPIAFPTTVLALTNCYVSRGAAGDYRAISSYDTSGANFGTDNCTTMWIALGY